MKTLPNLTVGDQSTKTLSANFFDFFCIITQSANVFSANPILSINMPKFFTIRCSEFLCMNMSVYECVNVSVYVCARVCAYA